MPRAYELPAPGQPFDTDLFALGKPCKRNHVHTDGMTLRSRRRRTCVLCERIDSYERQQRLRQNPEYRRRQAVATAERRKRNGRSSRSKYGLPYTPAGSKGISAMTKAIRTAGRFPSVAQLVHRQQLSRWRTHPDERLIYLRQRSKLNARWKYLTDYSYRLYHRAKSKARKVKQRGGTPNHLTADHLWRHWNSFGHCCAYCGATGDLEVEHVVPISRGGQHCLSNIVPACHCCNSNKGTKDAHVWYKSKPFYQESRWQQIQGVLVKAKPISQQLSIWSSAA